MDKYNNTKLFFQGLTLLTVIHILKQNYVQDTSSKRPQNLTEPAFHYNTYKYNYVQYYTTRNNQKLVQVVQT